MVNRELNRQLQKIEDLFSRTDGLNSDVEFMSHWAKYICVRCAGFLENSVVELYGNYATVKSDTTVSNYVIAKLKHIKNPKTNTLVEIAGMFNQVWRDDLEKYVAEEGRKEAIDAIMNNRHLIAHGKDSSITITRVRDYFNKSLEVMDFIESQLT